MSVSEKIILQIEAQFAPGERQEVARQLARYGADPKHREVEGIHRAILELAGGDLQSIAHLVTAALADYRDIFYWLTFDENNNPPPRIKFKSASVEPVIPPAFPEQTTDGDMRLLMLEAPDYVEQHLATNPSPDLLDRRVAALPWQSLTFLVLRIDEDYWLEGSGSLLPEDGLSARCCVGGVKYVSCQAPATLDELLGLFKSFAARDGRWRTMIEWC